MTTPTAAAQETSSSPPTARRTLLGAFAFVVLYRMFIGVLYARHLNLIGDEKYYLRVAQWLTRFVNGNASWEATQDTILARTWFMPGPGIHAFPARFFTDRPDLVRLWMGSIDIGLLAIATWLIARRFSRRFAIVFVLAIGLWPHAAVHSFTLWGESHGSLLLLISFLVIFEIADRAATSSTLMLMMSSAGAGLLVGWSIYLRPPFLAQVLTCIIAVVVGVGGRTDVSWKRAGLMVATLVSAIVLIIAPWSSAASEKVGGRVLTTITFDVNLIQAFGEHEEIIEAVGGTTFNDLERYFRLRMETNGETYADAIRHTRRDFVHPTVGSYLEDTNREVDSYLSEDTGFLSRFGNSLGRKEPNNSRIGPLWIFDALVWLGNTSWWLLAVAWLAAMLTPTRLDRHGAFAALLVKVALTGAAVQPWISNAKYRHLGSIFPLVFVAILIAIQTWRKNQINAPDQAQWQPWAVKAARLFEVLAGLFSIVVFLRFVL